MAHLLSPVSPFGRGAAARGFDWTMLWGLDHFFPRRVDTLYIVEGAKLSTNFIAAIAALP
jgi:hypothetical protein